MSAVQKKSTPGKFAYTCHFQQIGINATKIEKREFILKLTFSLPLPSSMLKLPNGPYGEAPPERGIFVSLQVYERVGISLVDVYETVGKSVISVCKKAQND